MPYSLDEWTVIFAAYAYEVESNPIMRDGEFDFLCDCIVNSTIPNFYPTGTGMWVHDVMKEIDHDFIRAATAKLRMIGKGASASHIRYPDGYLYPIPEWQMPNTFDHISP